MERIRRCGMLPFRKYCAGDGDGAPGEVLASGRLPGMLRTRVYTSADGGKIVEDPSMAEMEALMTHPDTRIWVDFNNPTEEEFTILERDFGILPLTIEDLMRQGQRAKLEEFDSYDYLVAFDMHYMNNAIATAEVDFL